MFHLYHNTGSAFKGYVLSCLFLVFCYVKPLVAYLWRKIWLCTLL